MPIPSKKVTERRVKVFKNGRNRAARIPREFEFAGDEAIMRKEGNKLIVEPASPESLLELLASLKPIDEDFAPIRGSPPESVDSISAGHQHCLRYGSKSAGECCQAPCQGWNISRLHQHYRRR
jgi:antitoxin VapB